MVYILHTILCAQVSDYSTLVINVFVEKDKIYEVLKKSRQISVRNWARPCEKTSVLVVYVNAAMVKKITNDFWD